MNMGSSFSGLADDSFGNLILVPREHMPKELLSAAQDITEGELHTFQARPPCRVEYYPVSGWYMVTNQDRNNCLRFTSKPGAVVTYTPALAAMACEKFNKQGEAS